MYMQARYYDPLIGRFYSNDPVDTLGHLHRGNNPAHGFNRYAYANNNPYKYTDPDGEFIHLAVGFAVGFAVEAITQVASGQEFDATKATISGIAGAVTGGVSAITKSSLQVGGKVVASTLEKAAANVTNVATGAATAATSSAVNDSLSGSSIDTISDNAGKAAVGSVIGPAKAVGMNVKAAVDVGAGALGKSGSKVADKLGDVASGVASNAVNEACKGTEAC
ncbi:RHS repeat-associated core domain-containing protein [Parashewanella tropica]|uniref:RHS repeat-associated core domain-containing protein n=1 Tax=Parashewanella tropica TaxID=2547970 RepID=UPI001FE93ED1|nr:RHS repeat-associated core domain-containing protein [Parashewanella tropica]